MTNFTEYAQLAERAYVRERSDENLPLIPKGWTPLYETPILASGFQAGVYSNGSEIVIAFAGTSGTDILHSPNARADWITNIGTGFGFASDQLYQAVRLYAQVARGDFGGAGLPISLTGHSLGGGLASVLTGLFGVLSTTFEMAPFEAALNVNNVRALAADLRGLGFTEKAAELQSLVSTVPRESPEVWELDRQRVLAREGRVNHWAITGEALATWRADFDKFALPLEIPINLGTPAVSSFALHSMSLTLAAEGSQPFRMASQRLPNLLKWMFDENLYARNLRTGTELDFLQRLNRYQFSYAEPGYTTPTAMLDRFGKDMQRLAVRDGLVSQRTLQDALIVTGIEYYNFVEPTVLANFFRSLPGGIRFDLDSITAVARNEQKGYRKLREFVEQNYSSALLTPSLLALDTRRWWYLQAGKGGMSATADTADSTVMIGGSMTDQLSGAAGNDLLLGGEGADILTGSSGDDILAGGTGFDTYNYRPSDGSDTIVDQDGQGVIVYDPDGKAQVLGVGLHKSTDPDGQYKSADGSITYRLDGDLTIETAGGTITVKNYNPEDLGIRLIDLTPDATAAIEWPAIDPDRAAAPNERTAPNWDYLRDGTPYNDRYDSPDRSVDLFAGNSVAPDGSTTPLYLHPGPVQGSGGADIIHGFGGDDDLWGNGGGDRIFGDSGDDFIGTSGDVPITAMTFYRSNVRSNLLRTP